MADHTDELADVNLRLRAAFPVFGVPRNPDELIKHPCDECFSLRDTFAGRRWIDIPETQIHAHSGELSLFSPVGLHYYLPAFMTAATRPGGTTVLDFVIYQLCPDERFADRFNERLSLFSEEQLSATAFWLYHVLTNQIYEADLFVGLPGFEKYWTQHLRS